MRKYMIGVTLLAATVLAGCSKFLDVNDDPNAAKSAAIDQLLTFAQVRMATSFGVGNFLGTDLHVYTHQMTTREDDDRYGMRPTGNGLSNTWNYVYLYVIPNTEAVIAEAEKKDYTYFAGIGKIMLAYTYMRMVDTWGPIPMGNTGSNQPPLMDDSELYNQCITWCEEALIDLDTANALKNSLVAPGSGDLYYGGDVNKWKRLANTMILRMLNNTRNVKDKITGYDNRLAALFTKNFFLDENSDFEYIYTVTTTPSDERNPLFVSTYMGSSVTYMVSPWFWEIMTGNKYNATNNPFVGISDPRVPYYFYRQATGTTSLENETSYRDGGFVSIFFGDNSNQRNNSQAQAATLFGSYPCGGRYDDNSGNMMVGGSTTNRAKASGGATNMKMLSYADYLYICAEMKLAGVAQLPNNADVYLKDAITASFKHVNKVSATQTNIPNLISEVNIAKYTDSVMARYNAGGRELEIIMTSKWIHDVMNSFEQYADYRRTGYPTLFVPGNPGISPYSSKGQPNALEEVPTVKANDYPKSLYYQNTETILNPNVPQKPEGQLNSKPVFWDTRSYK